RTPPFSTLLADLGVAVPRSRGTAVLWRASVRPCVEARTRRRAAPRGRGGGPAWALLDLLQVAGTSVLSCGADPAGTEWLCGPQTGHLLAANRAARVAGPPIRQSQSPVESQTGQVRLPLSV